MIGVGTDPWRVRSTQALGAMASKPQAWLIFRIVLIALSAPVWLLIRNSMQGAFSAPPSWYFPFVLVGFSAFGVVFLSVFRSDKDWVAPTWRGNPFDGSRPLEGFHLSGWSFLAGAFALLLIGLLRDPTDWAWVLPGCIGLGLLSGVRLVSIPEHRHGT
jgi:hypothetical protein